MTAAALYAVRTRPKTNAISHPAPQPGLAFNARQNPAEPRANPPCPDCGGHDTAHIRGWTWGCHDCDHRFEARCYLRGDPSWWDRYPQPQAVVATALVQPAYRSYRDDQGRIITVADGISQGAFWGAYYVKPNGAFKRIRSKLLPIRRTVDEAQADLDFYAQRMKYQEATL